MASTTAVAGGVHRTVALVLGKTGVYASVNGSQPTPLPLPQGEGQLSLTNDTLLEMLDTFTLADKVTKVLIIGTRSDGTPGWDGVDHRELENYGPSTLTFEALSEAEALHRCHPNSTDEGDFLVYSVESDNFAHGLSALAHNNGEVGVNAFMIFATVVEGDRTKGSVRCWKQNDGGDVTLSNVFYMDNDFGQIFTITGESIVTDPALTASLIEWFLRTNPDVSRVWIWSQDGLATNANVVQGGRLWRYLQIRMLGDFRENDGKVILVATALDVARLASAPAVPAQHATGDPTPTAPAARMNEKEDGA